MEIRRILAINPGSTSTKIAVYQGDKPVFLKNIKHSEEELSQFKSITDQFGFRKNIIMRELEKAEIRIDLIEVVVGRGGAVKPIESGVYEVNEKLKSDLRKGILGAHASNLGGLIADDISRSLANAKAYIVDPIVVDELQDVARISGHPEFQRKSIFHALNHKAIGRTFAHSIHKRYEDLNIIVAHLGGGISIGAHRKGRVIDVNNGLDGEGPFSPERSGTLPTGALARFCFGDGITLNRVAKMINGEGGLVAHLGTNDAYKVELAVKSGDEKAKLIQEAMSYQVAKFIGAMATVLKGEVDAILLTGGIAHNSDLVSYIKDMVSFIAPVVVYPGEDEMRALAINGYMVLCGEIKPKVYG